MAVILDLGFSFLWLWVLYALLSTAFALGFRVGGFFDLSVGVSFLLGAYGSWACSRTLPLFGAVSVGVVLAALGSVIIGRWLVAPLAVRLPPLALFIVTLALLYIAQASIALVFGEAALVLRSGPAPALDLGVVNITYVQIAFGSVAAASLAGVGLWLHFSPWGRFARAVADDRGLANLFGIPVQGTILRSHGFGGALAGLAGGFVVADKSVDPSQALTVLLAAMVAAMLGGESILAAVLGASMLAGLETVFGFALPGNWGTTLAFTVLLAVLVARSGGLSQVVRRQM